MHGVISCVTHHNNRDWTKRNCLHRFLNSDPHTQTCYTLTDWLRLFFSFIFCAYTYTHVYIYTYSIQYMYIHICLWISYCTWLLFLTFKSELTPFTSYNCSFIKRFLVSFSNWNSQDFKHGSIRHVINVINSLENKLGTKKIIWIIGIRFRVDGWSFSPPEQLLDWSSKPPGES